MPDDIDFILHRQRLAYGKPFGSWVQRWVPGVCKHEEVRCCHGDERNRAATRCLICGRKDVDPFPDKCFFTGKDH